MYLWPGLKWLSLASFWTLTHSTTGQPLSTGHTLREWPREKPLRPQNALSLTSDRWVWSLPRLVPGNMHSLQNWSLVPNYAFFIGRWRAVLWHICWFHGKGLCYFPYPGRSSSDQNRAAWFEMAERYKKKTPKKQKTKKRPQFNPRNESIRLWKLICILYHLVFFPLKKELLSHLVLLNDTAGFCPGSLLKYVAFPAFLRGHLHPQTNSGN